MIARNINPLASSCKRILELCYFKRVKLLRQRNLYAWLRALAIINLYYDVLILKLLEYPAMCMVGCCNIMDCTYKGWVGGLQLPTGLFEGSMCLRSASHRS